MSKNYLYIDEKLFGQLVREYRKADEAGAEQFELEGHEFVTGYAKYLIMHLENVHGWDAGKVPVREER